MGTAWYPSIGEVLIQESAVVVSVDDSADAEDVCGAVSGWVYANGGPTEISSVEIEDADGATVVSRESFDDTCAADLAIEPDSPDGPDRRDNPWPDLELEVDCSISSDFTTPTATLVVKNNGTETREAVITVLATGQYEKVDGESEPGTSAGKFVLKVAPGETQTLHTELGAAIYGPLVGCAVVDVFPKPF